MIVARLQRFQRVVGAEDTAAAGAQYVPAEIKKPEARRMQEARYHLLLVEAGAPGKVQRIDPVELAVRARLDQLPDRVRDRRIGGLLQNRNLGLNVAHRVSLNGSAGALRQFPSLARPDDKHGRTVRLGG